MRITAILFCLPHLAGAFAPRPVVRSPLFTRDAAMVSEPAAVHDFNDNVSGKIQAVLEKADDLVFKRGMRFVNHAPVLVTLGTLLSQLGSTRFGFDIAPSALAIASPVGLSVPTWVGYALPVMVVSQVAAVLRSSLADEDELSQEDISAVAVSNFALARALGEASTLNWVIAAIASGYYARNGHGDDDTRISNISIQITSALTSIAAVLGIAAKLPQWIPLLQGQEQVTAIVGLAGYLGLATRDGNGTVKKTINAAVMGGVLVSKIASGALNVKNLLRFDTIVTVATAFVAVLAIDKARDALAN